MSIDVDSKASMNLDEKIQQLLEEGRRLGSVEAKPAITIENNPLGRRRFSDDVTKLIREIEDQNQKTQELQNEIKQATESFRVDVMRPSFHSNMNANNNNSNFLGSYGDVLDRPHRGGGVAEHLEKALEDSQAQVKYLTKKLEDSHETAEKQKVHFRTAVEELQMKLQETIAGRKHLVQLRETEMEEQGEMIHKLQTTLKELAAANQMQEQSLHEANDRMQLLEKRNTASDSALERIRCIFSSHDKIRGKTYRASESECLSELSPDFITENVERAMNETYEEIEAMRNRIMDLETEICDIKQNHEREVDMLSVKQQEVAEQMKIETNERVLEEKLNADSAMKQVYSLQDDMKQQNHALASKEQEIRDIEKELTVITAQFEELKSRYFDDKESLQTKLLDVEAELVAMKQSNETHKHEAERLKQQLSDSQENFLRTNGELKSEREQRRNLWIKESESSKEINTLRKQLEEKVAEISELKQKTSDLKETHSTQLAEKVRDAELVERSKAEKKVTDLNEEMTRLREDLSRTKATLESTERQISDIMVERSDGIKRFQDKDLQCERLTNQCNIAERKLAEATEAKKNMEEKSEKLYKEYSEILDKSRENQTENLELKATLGEKERELVTLQLRYEAVSAEAEKVAKDLEEAKVERSKASVEAKERTKDLEGIRNQQILNEKTISDYENRIGELIQEKNRIASGSQRFEEENLDLKRFLEKVQEELEAAKSQIPPLIAERDELKKRLGDVESRSKNDCEKLKNQLKHVKRNLKETEKSLMTIKSVDGRAARIAESMQKEVTDKRSFIDSLQSELSRTIDRLSIFEKENKTLNNELEDVQSLLKECEIMKQKLELDLKESKKTEKGYRLAVERLEKGLENAAVRNSEAQSTIMQQEKDIAQLHIQHKTVMMNKRMAVPVPVGQPSSNLYQPGIAQPSTGIAQSMLARLILNMTSQRPSMPESMNQLGKGPVGLVKGDPEHEKNDGTVQADMYKLLSEVRDHLVKLEKPATSTAKKRSPFKKKGRKSKSLEETIAEYDDESFLGPDTTSDIRSAQSVSLLDGATRGSSLDDTLMNLPLDTDALHHSRGAKDLPPSPVSELLGQLDPPLKKLFPDDSRQKRPRRVLQDNTDSNSGMTSDTTTDIPASSTAVLKNAISTTAEDLCRQLQDRLEGLSRMGGKLKQQNKMTGQMIKKQDEKLQKVKGMKLR